MSRRKYYAFVQVSETEHALLKTLATKEGFSVADFMRRCVNSYLLELGDDVPLLAEKEQARRSTRNVSDVSDVAESQT